MDCSPPHSSVHGDSPGNSTGLGCYALLQGIFPTQESNWGLLYCRQIPYQLSCQGSLSRWVPGTKGQKWLDSPRMCPPQWEVFQVMELPSPPGFLPSAASCALLRWVKNTCLTPCGILPDQGSNLCPLHWQQSPNREGRPRSNSSDLLSKVLAKELAKMESLEVKKFQPS